MSHIFDLDSPVVSVMNRIVDLVWINILTLLLCIPVITAGAAITSMYYVLIKMKRKEDSYITKMYFKSFKQNFLQATLLWIFILLVGLGMVGTEQMLALREGAQVLRITIAIMFILYLCVVSYVFPILSRFDNSIARTLLNAFLMCMVHLPKTILIVLIHIAFCVAYYLLFLRAIPFIFLAGFSLPAFLATCLLSGIFKKYEPVEDVEEESIETTV